VPVGVPVGVGGNRRLIAKFRGNLKARGIPFHVEVTAIPPDPDWNADGHPIVPVSLERIADLVRQSRRALVF